MEILTRAQAHRDGTSDAQLQRAAAAESCGPGAIVSHASAAVMYGFDCGGVRLDTGHMTRNRCSGGRKSQTLHLHPAVVPPEQVVRVDGVATTSLARTFVDLARTTSFENAVVIGDCALRRGVRGVPLGAGGSTRLRARPGKVRAGS
ncbi:hypothetical protein R3Q06_06560 [Rhodococcus erythropolis]|uniref:hypothetical protein n=1 Tax=Rhodococcus erythropolis TaxID=1833 RepID=UPI00294A216F|nr:hypothetical protein [Rhodococcus erythropolis]MDV6273156.1 hypothetical protein [Rhodococcus erythropolis]